MKSEICKAHQKVNHVELALLPSTRKLYWLSLLEVCGKMKKYCKLDTFTTERLKRGTNRNLEVRSSLHRTLQDHAAQIGAKGRVFLGALQQDGSL